jgi:alkaline phosphatase
MKPKISNILGAIGVVATVVAIIPGMRAGEVAQTSDDYFGQGQAALAARLAIRPIDHRARNVIVFIADGSGVASNTAIRIADGQRRGETGEENVLAYEAFPHLALSKTYNIDAQVPDSAGTATAILSGVKTRKGVVGVGPEAITGDCSSALAHPVATLGELAEARGMATGIVTTARLTHATPAAFYAHSANRNWEDDGLLPPGSPCKDIAHQLIEFPFEVAMGGGRQHFLPSGVNGIERGPGLRADGRDLMAVWRAAGPGRVVVQIRRDFDRLTGNLPDRLLGLFSPSHMAFEADRRFDWGGEPSLAEMTRTAIEILSRGPDGFVLLVEAGRIDHAFHAVDLHRAVTEGIALNEAVRVAAAMTDTADTLIIVTSDHTDPMPPWGHRPRGAPVVDFDGWSATDHPPPPMRDAPRGLGPIVIDLTGLTAIADSNNAGTAPPVRPAAGPGSHGPADVAIYARGPMAYLIDGTVEQHYIFHVISHALGFDAPE